MKKRQTGLELYLRMIMQVSIAVIALSAVSAFPAQAEDSKSGDKTGYEELSDLLTNWEYIAPDSGLSEYLGWEDMTGKASADGWSVQTRFGLTEETISNLMGNGFPSDAYLEADVRTLPEENKWQVLADAGFNGKGLLDLSLYRDPEIVIFSMPQFYGHPVGVNPDKIYEQYNGSGLQGFLEELMDYDPFAALYEDGFSDLLQMLPSEKSIDSQSNRTSEYKRIIDEDLQSIDIEKTGEGEKTSYTVHIAREDILEWISDAANTGIEYLYNTGYLGEISSALFNNDYYANENPRYLEKLFQRSLDENTSWIGEESLLEFDAFHDLLTGISWTLDICDGDETFGYIQLQASYLDSEEPEEGSVIRLALADTEEGETEEIRVEKHVEKSEDTFSTTLELILDESGDKLLDQTFYSMSFNPDSEELKMSAGYYDQYSDYTGLRLISEFHDVNPGESFGLTVDELSWTSGSETIGLTAEISVEADGGIIEYQQTPDMLMDMDETDLLVALYEITYRANNWAEDLETGMYSYSEENDSYELQIADDEPEKDDSYKLPEIAAGTEEDHSDDLLIIYN